MGMPFWILALCAGLALASQAWWLRQAHQRRAAKMGVKLQQMEQVLNGRLEQTRKQIGRLQLDLADARRQLKERGIVPSGAATVAPEVPVGERLSAQLDAAPSRVPADGFADTQPSPDGDTKFGASLLFS